MFILVSRGSVLLQIDGVFQEIKSGSFVDALLERLPVTLVDLSHDLAAHCLLINYEFARGVPEKQTAGTRRSPDEDDALTRPVVYSRRKQSGGAGALFAGRNFGQFAPLLPGRACVLLFPLFHV